MITIDNQLPHFFKATKLLLSRLVMSHQNAELFFIQESLLYPSKISKVKKFIEVLAKCHQLLSKHIKSMLAISLLVFFDGEQ